ncbi:MAG: thioredoxin family protein [Saprospiraceae bacterium]|nr:thioredoxin family protein [Saprospiraceae bacterium]
MKTNLLFITLLLPAMLLSNSADEVFHKGNYLTAKKEALASGKHQLVEFVAEWCLPCKHMDETTFANDRVKKYLSDNYVSVKVDIDQFDGFALKEQYEVRYLPTIVILDPEGELVSKIENALGPVELLDKLKSISDARESFDVNETDQNDRQFESDENDTPDSPGHPDNKVSKSSYYTLQFGVFSQHQNARKLSDSLTNFLPSTPGIRSALRNGKTLFIVEYGPFKRMENAEKLRIELKKDGFNSIIKDIE